MTTNKHLHIYVCAGAALFLSLVFPFCGWCENNPSSHHERRTDSPIPVIPVPPVSMKAAQTVFPRPEVPSKIWNLPNGGKVFIDLKKEKATIIFSNGDRKIYVKVQSTPSEMLEQIAKFQEEEIWGRLEEMDYVDGSSDLYLSPRLTATLDSSRRLVDLSMTEALPKGLEFLVPKLSGFMQGKQSLTSALNLALTGDAKAARQCLKIIEAAKNLNLSNQPSDVRAQIIETLHRNESLLKSMGES